ncbi:Short-chain dehydrogenase/reductase SDR [Pleurostoma richardsiae]|uniref:Short-chain dehydrogenase/reductase SDR n=1 Tax=Pleurostoma richardsiae TaxID=41990 RepID=A0AA38VQH8_9PEZI|nr:Short-chain dehydrogenase/reductase SDR [Pleurostoma richardsiae]
MAEKTKYAVYPSLADRVIVVSGGAMGIGAAIVEQFARQGSQVIFLDIDADAAGRLVEKVDSLRVAHRPIFHHCDLGDIDGAVKPVTTKILADFPRVHGLINNAAATAKEAKTPTMDITPEIWGRSLDLNLRHQFFLTQALMPGLLAAGESSVINMGSISWVIPATGTLSYTTSKAAVVGLTRTLAHEFGPKGVRVNSIMPGSIATEREKREIHTPEYKALVLDRQAVKRLLQPEDVARTALWLVADDGAGITNQSIVIDGGWT